MTIDTNADGNPEQWGMDRMWARWYMWVHQTGALLYDRVIDPTQSHWNDPRVVQGLQFPVTVLTEKLGPRTSSPNYTRTYFWFGNTAMSLVDGPGAIGAYLKDRNLSYNVAPQVRGPVNAGTEITVNAFEMVNTSMNKDAAWEWLKFISLDTDSHAKFVEMTGRAPSLSALQRRYQQLCPYLPGNYMAFFEATAAEGTMTNYIIADAAINAAVNPVMTQLWSGTVAIESATAQLHEQLKGVFAARK